MNSTTQAAAECLASISSMVVAEADLDDLLAHVYQSCTSFLPYHRIGHSEIDVERDLVRATWLRSDTRALLRHGYAAPLHGSSLYFVMQQRKPRIMDDLQLYLEHRPQSRSTALMVREGIRSSFTCPLFIGEQPLGFLFFSSRNANAYSNDHIPFAMEVSKLVSLRRAAILQQRPLEKVLPLENVLPLASQKLGGPQRIALQNLKPGMILAERLASTSNNLLLASGSSLSAQSIHCLEDMSASGKIAMDSIMIDGIK